MSNLRSAVSVLGALALAVTLGAPAASASTDAVDVKTQFMLSASGFGSQVSAVDGLLKSGKTAYVGFGCTQKAPIDRSNEVAGADLDPLGEVGAITTHVTSTKAGKTVTTESHTTIADLSLLDGEIQIEGLEVVARASHEGGGYTAETETTAASIIIGGEAIELGEDRQEIVIPGVAEIVLNASKTTEKLNRSAASATALSVKLLGGDVARITIGQASAEVDGRRYEGTFTGGGYGTTVELAGIVESGKTAKKALPCLGTGGQDRTNSTAAVEAGPVEIGAVQTTVNGDSGAPEATVTAEVADVNISLGGLAGIAIRGIKAVSHVEEDGAGNVTTSHEGSEIGELVITTAIGIEIPITLPVDPNTTVDLLGLGTLEFITTEELKNGRGLAVTAATVTVPVLDLELVLANARATIR